MNRRDGEVQEIQKQETVGRNGQPDNGGRKDHQKDQTVERTCRDNRVGQEWRQVLKQTEEEGGLHQYGGGQGEGVGGGQKDY